MWNVEFNIFDEFLGVFGPYNLDLLPVPKIY